MARPRPNPPPARHGVAASCVSLPHHAPPGQAWATVADFLVHRFGHIEAPVWQQRLANGSVLTADGEALTRHSPFQPGLLVYYFRDVPGEVAIPFEHQVLHQDEHLLVVDKPHFLPVMPSGKYLQETLLVRLKNSLGLADLAPIHRIDRDTAGLVMFSVNPATRDHYHRLFRERQVQKVYEAIAPWAPALPWGPDGQLRRESHIAPSSAHFMQQSEQPGEPNAVTDIRLVKVLARDSDAAPTLARYELRPLTGRRHQLRVHMNALGLPILNDGIYPVLTPEGASDYSKPLQLLARSLAFADPVTSRACRFVSVFELSY